MLTLRQLILLKNSLFLAGGTMILSVVFGLPLGFLVERVKLPFKKIIQILIFVPLLVPPYLHAIAWRFVSLQLLNYSTTQLPLYNLPAAILIMSLAYFPIVTLLVMFALKNIDARLEEAGELFCSKWGVWRKVTLPLTLPTVAAAAFFVFILSITNFGVPSLLHVNVFTFEIFSQFSAFFNFQKALILSWPLLLLAVGLLFVAYRFVLKGKSIISITSGARKVKAIQISLTSKVLTLGFVAVLLFNSSFLPIFSFLIQAGSAQSFIFAFKSSSDAIGKSLFLSAVGASLITMIGLMMSRLARQNIIRFVTLLFLTLPSITIGIVLIRIFNRPILEAFYISFWIIIAGFLLRFFPYASEVLQTFFAQIDKKLIEAAKLTGASNWQILKKILIPLLAPGLITAWMVSFILCLSELGTTILIHPPGWQTLPIRIYILMHYGAPELVAALCLILIAITIIPFAFLLYFPFIKVAQ